MNLPVAPGASLLPLFSTEPASIYTTTADGRILDCNEAMVDMLGYESRGDLISRPASDLYFAPGDRRDFLRRLRMNGKLVNTECRLKRKDGAAIHVLENVNLLPDETGKMRIIHGNMVDITERNAPKKCPRASRRIGCWPGSWLVTSQNVRESEGPIAQELAMSSESRSPRSNGLTGFRTVQGGKAEVRTRPGHDRNCEQDRRYTAPHLQTCGPRS
jgi:PAS domain S-box-containing protein